jgi:hypothetical protein
MDENTYDAIVIGSGLCGVHSASPLVDAGLRVLMLDVGNVPHQRSEQETRSFEDIRRTDPDQYKLFLGEDFSGVDLGGGHAKTMVSGQRSHIVRDASALSPLESGAAQVLQTFARGGLSEAWSGICDVYDDEELSAVGLPIKEMKSAYQAVIDRIGVSGLSSQFSVQEAPVLDESAKQIFSRYNARTKNICARGFEIRHPLYALLTRDIGDRKATGYRDMDFWDDGGKSLYRARYTLEELSPKENFTYLPRVFVDHVGSGTTAYVSGKHVDTGDAVRFSARAVLMAAGAVQTTRIVLRSLNLFDAPAPILMKNHYHIPFLIPSRIGKPAAAKNHSLAQVTMHGLSREKGMSSMFAQMIGYKSLLLYKLLNYSPLSIPESSEIFSVLAPALIFGDFRFPTSLSAQHSLTLSKTSAGERIRIAYPDDDHIKRTQDDIIKKAKSTLRSLGLYALTSVRHMFGATSQYAGGVPMGDEGEFPAVVQQDGSVAGLSGVYVADAASWRALPSKPSGLTMMANAHRIGSGVAARLR